MSEKGSIEEQSMEGLRGAARWVVGAAAAVGAIMVAGVQVGAVASIGPGEPIRLTLALGAVGLGLLAVGFVIGKASAVLTSPRVSLVQIRDRELQAKRRAAVELAKPATFDDAAERDQVLRAIHSHRHLLLLSGATSPHDLYYRLDRARAAGTNRGPLEEDAGRLTEFASSFEMRTRYSALLRWLGAAGVSVAVAIVSFAWAVTGSTPAAVTEPIPVEVVLTGDPRDVALDADCPQRLRGVAVGGDLAEPEVVIVGVPGDTNAECFPARFVVTREVGIAIPLLEGG